MRLLVLRPQPGADATAARARALGLEPVVAPLFEIVGREWTLPEQSFDGIMLTSANAARMLGTPPAGLSGSPVWAVGAKTGAAARAAGFTTVHDGDRDVAALVAQAAAAGVRSLLHLAGEDRTDFDPGPLRIETRVVYASVPVEPCPALPEGVALLHSARAARRFRELAGNPARYAVAAISPAVLDAAGAGWRAAVAAEGPSDHALLAAAARLCQTGAA